MEGPHEGCSIDGVAPIGDDFCQVGEGFEGDEDSVEAVESVVVLGGNGSAVRNVLWWEHPEGQVVGVSIPGGGAGGDKDVSVVAG